MLISLWLILKCYRNQAKKAKSRKLRNQIAELTDKMNQMTRFIEQDSLNPTEEDAEPIPSKDNMEVKNKHNQ